MKPKIAVVRGKFLNAYEMQFYEPLVKKFSITGFGSKTSFHSRFAFPTIQLASPMDLPDFPFKMPVLNRIFTDAHYLFGLENKLKGFDIVHTAETYFHYTQQCLDAKRRGYVKKVIATVLENIPFNNEGITGRKDYKKRARVELDHIIALTNKTKDALLAEGADEKKITVISHFVDTKRFKPAADVERRRFAPNKKYFTVLFAGRLEEYKGVFDILDAAAMLRQDRVLKGFDIHYLFVGDGSQKEKMYIKEYALGLSGSVSHRSARYSEMPEIYNQADLFIAPSKPTPTYTEQYCTALLEAQAAGLPIVTTKSGGIPENIATAGILVAPGDSAAMAYALKNYMMHAPLRRMYGHKARKRAVTVHDSLIGAGKLARLYSALLT